MHRGGAGRIDRENGGAADALAVAHDAEIVPANLKPVRPAAQALPRRGGFQRFQQVQSCAVSRLPRACADWAPAYYRDICLTGPPSRPSETAPRVRRRQRQKIGRQRCLRGVQYDVVQRLVGQGLLIRGCVRFRGRLRLLPLDRR